MSVLSVYNVKKQTLIEKFTKNLETKVPAPQTNEKEGAIVIDDDCPVCLMNMNLGEQLHRCQVCHKYFHMECIKVWKKMSVVGTCPYCRSALILEEDTGKAKETAEITSQMKKIKLMVETK